MNDWLTQEDIDQVIEGIECFIQNGDPNVDAIWQPYIDKLKRLPPAPLMPEKAS